MILIEVEEKDKSGVFEILALNSKFIGLPNNQFYIVERAEEMLQKIYTAGLKIKVLRSAQ